MKKQLTEREIFERQETIAGYTMMFIVIVLFALPFTALL
jgi:hypothetical protein